MCNKFIFYCVAEVAVSSLVFSSRKNVLSNISPAYVFILRRLHSLPRKHIIVIHSHDTYVLYRLSFARLYRYSKQKSPCRTFLVHFLVRVQLQVSTSVMSGTSTVRVRVPYNCKVYHLYGQYLHGQYDSYSKAYHGDGIQVPYEYRYSYGCQCCIIRHTTDCRNC